VSKLALERVPQDLRERPVWLYWRSSPNGDAKPKKIPHYVDGERRAGRLDTGADRERLVTFDVAMRQFKARQYSGLGIALGPIPGTDLILSGIDLDHCRRDDVIAPLALEIIAAGKGAYAEISPSGSGVKMFGTGDIGTEKSADLEIYSARRFFTVTGLHVEGDRLADLTEAATLARRRLLQYQAANTAIAKGSRNNSLYRFACSLRARNLSDDAAWSALQARNATCLPPLPERELRTILASAWKHRPGFSLSDLGNAERVVARHGDDVRFVHEFDRFLIWHGVHWSLDRDGEMERRTVDTIRTIYDEARDEADDDRRKRLTQWALASQSDTRIRAAVRRTQSEVAPIAPTSLDADSMLLGVANGVVDLATGELRQPRRETYITKALPVAFDRAALAPQWAEFLSQIMGGDQQLVDYLQRAVGYCLSGRTDEQCLFLLFGGGSNGKSTFLTVLRSLFGDYGTTTDVGTWMTRDRSGPNNDLAALRGSRLVVASEVEDGARFAEVLVKLATGGDNLKARFLYGEFFEFRPQFKLWIAANHKPVIRGDDWAIWRRIRLLPFTVTISSEKQDRHLSAKLHGELPGILRWAIEGCLAWQRDGLGLPDAVREATDEYRKEMDHFGQFLTECCELSPKRTARANEVFNAYRHWAESQGIDYPWSMPRVWTKLAERGVRKVRGLRGYTYQGIGLRLSDPAHELGDGVATAKTRRPGGRS
jgi:P4 family phage/plasmid primase-like protien